MLEELGDLPNLVAWGARGSEWPESSIVDAVEYNYNASEGDLKGRLVSEIAGCLGGELGTVGAAPIWRRNGWKVGGWTFWGKLRWSYR